MENFAWVFQAWQVGGAPLVILGAFVAWLKRSPDSPAQIRKNIDDRLEVLEENLNGKIGALGDKVDQRVTVMERRIDKSVERLSEVEGRIKGWLDVRSAPIGGGANGESHEETKDKET